MTRIFIYDTTLRDGSQGEGVNFSLQDKLLITRRLDELGVDYIEGGYPLSNPKDAAYFREVRDLDLKHTRVTAFGMTRRQGIAAEDDAGMRALIDAHTPDAVAIEELFFGANVKTAFAVGQARGVVLLAAGQRGLPPRSYTPQAVKAAVCGHGAASKAASRAPGGKMASDAARQEKGGVIACRSGA